MAELADALDSGSSEGNFMQVQVLLPAPKNPVHDSGRDFYFLTIHFSLFTKLAFGALEVIGNSE